MQLRVSTVRKSGKTYRYAQLVESYRREDGVPTKRVVKHLGPLSEPVIEAFRVALNAARTGQSVVLASDVAAAVQGTTLANLRYLDLAVLQACWVRWGLSAEIDALAQGLLDWDRDVSLADTLFPLVAQRCCAPASKLRATRWVPTTALPELVGFDPAAFNNSRVHRALTGLHAVTGRLQERLPQLYQERDGAFAAMFMDATDTHFEGLGCPMAEQTRTKSEMPNKRCLSIVLLANEHGYPLRWKVFGGKTKDWTAMSDTLDELGGVPWLRKTPIVFDRAMGQPGTVAKLKATGLHFLTAAHVSSIESYTNDLPHAAFADMQLEDTEESYESDIERVAQAARDAGFEEFSPRLFAIELGVGVPAAELAAQAKDDDDALRRHRGLPGQLLRARAIREQMDANPDLTRAKVATSLGMSAARVTQLLRLLHFAPAVQERIVELGASCPVSEPQARPWLRLSPDEQLARLEEHEPKTVEPGPPRPAIGPLRMVGYFNPRLFVDIRRRTQGHCELLFARVEALNAELADTRRSREEAPTYRKFSHEVERLRYLDQFDIELEEIEVLSARTKKPLRSYRGTITRREDSWHRRRRYDGFVLLLAHPDLQRSASGIVQAYYSKDIVEKDFQTIKDLEKLRPVYHHTDDKVQAHVTICMLALLLQRTLRHRLAQAGEAESAPAALDLLATCHLNQRAPLDGAATYDLTRLTAEQRRILAACGLEGLATAGHVASKLQPRPATP